MNYLLIPLGAIARILPHLPNFTPIGAIALFGAANGRRRTALIAPLAALALSDIFIGGHATLPYVYASFALIALLGMVVFRNGVTVPRAVGASLASSMILFVISNFGVWASGTLYAPTFDGLVTCYAMALPYLRNTMLGDLFYTGVLFGGYAFARRHADLGDLVPVSVRHTDTRVSGRGTAL